MKGFTLIELLIVVAIIAILAAIAVPNFLEAQTRSKVSRAKADIKALVTATEAYTLDNNATPELPMPGQKASASTISQGMTNLEDSWFLWSNAEPPNPNPRVAPLLQVLTTPIAYFSSLPYDGAFGGFRFHLKMPFRGYYYNGGKLNYAINTAYLKDKDPAVRQSRGGARYMWLGVGPTKVSSSYYNGTWHSLWFPYDPTNGTISPGDITYFAGPGTFTTFR